MPVEASAAKFIDGDPTDPLIKLIEVDPAKTVLALTKFTESQINVACCPALRVAVDPEPVLMVTVKADAPPVVAF